jgi:hypothetical protein
MTSRDPNHDRLSHDNEKFQRIAFERLLDIPIRACLPPIWTTAFQPFQPMYCYKARIRVDRAQINIKSIKRDILVEL